MFQTGKRRAVVLIFTGVLFAVAASLGAALGLSIATNHNTLVMDELMASRPAIPSQILDINGELITEFFSDEKRDIVPITSLPENQIYALLTREDSGFFIHNGFSIAGFVRAMVNNAKNAVSGTGYFSGASTVTMQLAGARHADRTEISIKRKLKELWWTYQLERRFTKYEILEQYLNSVYFGHNTYGVEAASQFFFGHSAAENTPAESVMLVIQLAGSGLYSPIIQPDAARERQRAILNQMIAAKYVDAETANASFEDYWNDYDWSRSPTDSPYFDRLANDKAPYFTEYIRGQIDQYLFGQQDIYRDGYVIHTTLNLDYQRMADKQISEGLQQWNLVYRSDRDTKTKYASAELVQTIDLLSLVFGLPEMHVAGAQEKRRAQNYLENELAPIMDIMALSFGLTDLKAATNLTYERAKSHAQMNNVETALITLDNSTGYILAMIGGSEFNRNNQFNRAMDANVMPGSAYKPLYYSAAISSGKFTAATRIYDGPEVFISPDGSPYIPGNYAGRWAGSVLLRNALARSLNIPALKVFEGIGFDAAIERSAALLGISDPEEIGRTFDRVYPLALGTLSVTPVKLARAYATLANGGKAVEPLAIRYIEDRDGNVIVNAERELRESQERKNMQVLSPQAAYIMTSMLQNTLSYGTLAYARRTVDGFDGMPIAGKTGTTQNWTDAWAIGYSPYYTTSLWIGFDKRGNSLGRFQTGAQSAGPFWARYMKNIHEDLTRIPFPRPQNGLVDVEIDNRTGMLPHQNTPDENRRVEIFIAGTEPRERSTLTEFEEQRDADQVIKITVDSSLTNPGGDDTSSAIFNRELFRELGLDPMYLDDNRNSFNNSRDPGSSGASGGSNILD